MKSAPQNESRCAPPSELPAMTSGDLISVSVTAWRLRRAAPRSTNCIWRSSASERSRNVSSGSLPCSSAMSHTVRPIRGSCSGRFTVSTATTCHTNTNDAAGRVGDLARASGRGPLDRASRSDRRGSGSVSVSRNDGISSKRNVESSEKCAPCRLVANIGCTSRPAACGRLRRTRGSATNPRARGAAA